MAKLYSVIKLVIKLILNDDYVCFHQSLDIMFRINQNANNIMYKYFRIMDINFDRQVVNT